MAEILRDFTVVVPTIGRPSVQRCLRSIASGTAWPTHLLVVDQTDSAEVADLVSDLRREGIAAEHVRTPEERFAAAATNRGFRTASTRFIALTHDDCEVDRDWLSRLSGHLQEHPDAIVTGMVRPGDGPGVVPSTIVRTEPDVHTAPSWRLGTVLYPNNMGCARELFWRVGPFDERAIVRSAEDGDWCYRALRSGIAIRYFPDAAVTHLDWRSPADLNATYRSYARSQGGFYGKHLRRLDPFIAMMIPIEYARALRRWVAGVVRRDAEQAVRGRAYLFELPAGIIAGMRSGDRPTGAEVPAGTRDPSSGEA